MDINDEEFAGLPPEKQLSALFRAVASGPTKTVEAMKTTFITREEHAQGCPLGKKPPTEPWSFAAIRNALVVVALLAVFVGVASGFIPIAAIQGLMPPQIAGPK